MATTFKKTKLSARNAAVTHKPGGKKRSTTKITVAKVKKKKPTNRYAAAIKRK
jgi:hypothetical protein